MAKQRDDRPLYTPELPMTHERYPADLKADQINEWIPVFTESDAGKRPDHPTTNFRLPEYLSFEEYSEILKDHFHMKLKDGIVEAKAYTPGEKGWIWGTPPHAFLHMMFKYVHEDHDAEVLIFGSEGENFFESIGMRDCHRDTSKPFQPVSEFVRGQMWSAFQHQYQDGTNDIEEEVNIEIPTIAVWQGGAFHSDIFLFADITIATEDAWMAENHFRINMYPGDGVQIIWRMLMGQKRFAYAELTGEIVTARKALEYGMINEITTDVDAAYKRAWEIAELIMHTGTRQTRRLTVQCIRKPVKEAVADELKLGFATEMWNTITEQSPHAPIYWETAKAEARATIAAEKKGKVIRPRIGKFIEEDLIK
jgi:enoyl-CoA hydratase/carnithine racemase